MPSKEEKEAIDLELKELELQKKEIEMQKKEIELRRRKLGKAAPSGASAKPAKKQEDDISTLEMLFPRGEGPIKPKNPPKKLPPGVKAKDYKWRNLICVTSIPFVLLGVTVALMRYAYDEPICPTPCVGICSITKEMIAAAPKGCMPEQPSRILFNVMPGTSAEEKLLPMFSENAISKEFEYIKMRAWRDVGTHEPVFLSPVSKSQMKGQQYDGLYMQMNYNLVNVNANNTVCTQPKKMFAGKTYFWDLKPEENYTGVVVRPDPIRHITMLREPMERFRDQLDEEWSKRGEKNKFEGKKTDIFDKLDLPGCLDVKPCRMQRQLGKWCNLQTRVMCGWHRDCHFDTSGREINATQKMLDIALENLEKNYSAIMIAEEWDLSVKLLEATHPTYFEGLADRNAKIAPPYCKMVGNEQVCPRNAEKTASPMQLQHRKILEPFCWADTILYEKAKELLHKKTSQCGVA